MLENSILSRRGSELDSAERTGDESFEKADHPVSKAQKTEAEPDTIAKHEIQGEASEKTAESAALDAVKPQPSQTSAELQVAEATIASESALAEKSDINDVASASAEPPTEPQPGETTVNTHQAEEISTPNPDQSIEASKVPSSPPILQGDQHNPLSQGGIQWYMQPFDPMGTTIHEERWTGREVMRGLSEELSELDEEELKDLVADDELEDSGAGGETSANGVSGSPSGEAGVKVHRTRRRWRGFK